MSLVHFPSENPHRDAAEAVLARLQQGPLKAQDCQALRIAPKTLKAAIWQLRRRGYVITADRQWSVPKAPILYRLETTTPTGLTLGRDEGEAVVHPLQPLGEGET